MFFGDERNAELVSREGAEYSGRTCHQQARSHIHACFTLSSKRYEPMIFRSAFLLIAASCPTGSLGATSPTAAMLPCLLER